MEKKRESSGHSGDKTTRGGPSVRRKKTNKERIKERASLHDEKEKKLAR